MQRSARHIASKTDVAQSYAMGRAAVEFALKGHNAVMPTVQRVSNKPYKWKVGMAPLEKVANVEKMMPEDFITEDGFGITDKCRQYLAPLIQGEDYPPYRNGLPDYVRLKNVAVPKKLAASLLGASADCMEQTGFGPESLISPEPRLFVIGNKSYGRGANFLLRIGREQIRDVFRLVTGDET